jgi:hypothetical protein
MKGGPYGVSYCQCGRVPCLYSLPTYVSTKSSWPTDRHVYQAESSPYRLRTGGRSRRLYTGALSKKKGGPTVIHIRLGWVLSGPVALSSCSTNLVSTHVPQVDTRDDTLDETLRAFWELASLGT